MLSFFVPMVALGVSADIPPEYATKITVFHVNPVTYGAAPINMDTADELGDMYFDMRGVMTPIECAQNSSATAHDCDNGEVVSDDLVITKLRLEVDSRWGDYARCNICINGSDHHGHDNCTDGEYICGCGSFYQPGPCTPPVGRWNLTERMNRECKRDEPYWECWRSNVVKKTQGFWYSTLKEGYCGDGSSPPPANCTWRVDEVIKVVNKTCSDNSIYSEVEKTDKTSGTDCFSKCSDSGVGPARNTSSTCWITCFYETVLGPDASKPGGVVAGMPIEDLQMAWEAPFASEDPTKGGCKALKQDF